MRRKAKNAKTPVSLPAQILKLDENFYFNYRIKFNKRASKSFGGQFAILPQL